MVLAVQSLSMLRAAYGDARAHALLGNIPARVTFRPGDTLSAAELSRDVGQSTYVSQHFAQAGSSFTQTQQPLLAEHHARSMDERHVIVRLPGLPPIAAWRVGPLDVPGGPYRYGLRTPPLPEPPSEARRVPDTPDGVSAPHPPQILNSNGQYPAENDLTPARPLHAEWTQGDADSTNVFERLPADFGARVNVTPECWLWTGATSKGYPVYGRNKRGAHVVMFEASMGRQVRPGYEVDHLKPPDGPCTSELCVRPDHLQLLSAAEHRRVTAQRTRWRKQQVQALIDDALS
jgi:hypothetical protein